MMGSSVLRRGGPRGTAIRPAALAIAALLAASVLLVATPVASHAVAASVNASAHIRASSTSDAAATHAASGVLNQGTRTTDFDSGWKFLLVNASDTTDPTGLYGNSTAPLAQAPGFNDSTWRSVTLPHDWSIELQPQASVSDATGYFQGGLGWYRKTFTLPSSMSGKRISIDFDGVYMNSYVYLNGTLLGNHPYGYTGFSFDVTNLVHADGATQNVLAVVVQNQLPSSRWYSGSGITRNVHLTVSDPIHVTRNGVFVTTPDLATTIISNSADVHVATSVLDDDAADATVDVVSHVLDATGAVVAQATASGVALTHAAAATATSDVNVPNPHLWSTSDPYLYTLETDIVSAGNVVDSYATTFGMRWITFDPNAGVSLNGQPIKLHGVNLHNDEGALGSVDNYDALYREMSILKGMGANAFRTSHNPPSPEWVAICDRLGILMMVEAFDSWNVNGSGKLANDYHLYFDQWSDSDIKETVDESKNSPSVAMWSIGNEIPGWTDQSALPTAQRLIDDIHSIDTTRPVVAGSDQYRSAPATGSVAEQMLLKLDGLGLNYNPALVVDSLHTKYPTKFFFESESSSETSTRGSYQDPSLTNTVQNQTPGKRNASSYDNNLTSWTMGDEYGLKKDRDRAYFAGQFIWSGFDYIGEPTPYSVFPVKTSFFGAIDTAGFPKDAYYAFQSQWTSAPMVHIEPMNWTDYSPGEMVQVWVYSNVDSVELFLSGVSLGAKSFKHKTTAAGAPYLETTEVTNDDTTYTPDTGASVVGSYNSPAGGSAPSGTDRAGKLHLTWSVPFAPGRLVAIASRRADPGTTLATDEVDTAGASAALRLIPDKTVIEADGKSLSYVEVDVVDAGGVLVPDAANLVTLSVSGAGTLVGLDNGREEDAEGYKGNAHTAFNGKLLAIVESGTSAGPITVAASASGLAPVTTTLYANEASGNQLIAALPVNLRIPLGASPVLPSTVMGVHADGSTDSLPVTWDSLPAELATTPATYAIHAGVDGTAIPGLANVTVYAPAGVQGYSTATPVGSAPFLPPIARIVYTDGTDAFLPVTWDPLKAPDYAAPGSFSVSGSIAGVSLAAVATVRVTSDFIAGANLALASPAEGGATADASYSGATSGTDSTGATTSIPSAMLDGTTDSGGWSNRFTKGATSILAAVSNAHASDWVSVGWLKGQTFNQMSAYFTTGANLQQPAAIDVSYWDGLNWHAATNVMTTFAGASNAPSVITFDPIAATQVRLTMTSASPNDATTGNIGISELQVTGDQVVLSKVAALSDLRVNGQTVSGFDAAMTTYAVPVGQEHPQIEADTVANGSLLILAPLQASGTATVTVTSEDGSATRTYTLNLERSGQGVHIGG